MTLAKLGALTALGAVLALPAVAQTTYHGTSQGQNGAYNQAMTGQTGTNGWPGMSNGGQGNYSGNFGSNVGGGLGRQSSTFEGGGYGPAGTPGNFGANQYGQSGNGTQFGQYGNGGQYGQNRGMQGSRNGGMQGSWSNRHLIGHEVFALRQTLEQAGFSHIHVMPEAFVVRARDSQGHHVLMLVSPNSIEEMMAFNPGQMRQGMNQGMNQGGMNSGTSGVYGPNGEMSNR